MTQNRSIRRDILIGAISVLLVSLTCFLLVVIGQQRRDFEREAERRRIAYVESQKETVRNEVNHVVEFIVGQLWHERSVDDDQDDDRDEDEPDEDRDEDRDEDIQTATSSSSLIRLFIQVASQTQ